MVGLSTKARLTSASAWPSPSSTARTTSRSRRRSMGTVSCGLAMETRLIAPSFHNSGLWLGHAVDADHAGLAAFIDLDAGRQHHRHLAEHLAGQGGVVLGPGTARGVGKDRLAK